MNTGQTNLIEKKLRNVRKIIIICFMAFLACILLFTMPFSILVNRGETMEAANGMSIPVWPFFIISQVLAIAIVGGICLVIYYIFKYRTEKKEEDLFL